MKVRIIRGFDAYEPGQVYEDWPGGRCEILIARGLIEEVKEKAPVVERSVEEPEIETAEASPRPGKKPRK
jgi:hypothetical protein